MLALKPSLLRRSTLLLALAVHTLAQQAPTPPAPRPPQSAQALHLQHLLDTDDYLAYTVAMRDTDSTRLSENQRHYFLGMLAYHLGKLKDADLALVSAANGNSDHTLTSEQVANAITTDAEINMKLGRYGAAADDYNIIDTVFTMDPPARQDVRQNRHLAVLLKDLPPQTCDFTESFTLKPASTSTQYGTEYPIIIPTQPAPQQPLAAQFDTGAQLSVLSASTAKAWGVTLLSGTATLHGYGGGAFKAQPGVIPLLEIGSAHLHNVAVYVAPDQDLYFAPIKHQTNALLGFPVVAALGRLTFTHDGTLTVSPTSPGRGPVDAGLWFSDHALVVQLGTSLILTGNKLTGSNQDRLFVLDTGSSSTYLTDLYLAEHTNVFHGPPPSMAKLAGLDGEHDIPAFVANPVPLVGGNTLITLKGNHILAEPTQGETEHFFGLIGQDTLSLFPSYTLDLRTMSLSLTPP